MIDINKKVEIIYTLLNELEYGDLFNFNFSKLKNIISLDEYRVIESELIKFNLIDIKTEPNGNSLNGVAEFLINGKGYKIRNNKKLIKKLLLDKKPLNWYQIIPIIIAIFFGCLNIYQKYDYKNLKNNYDSLKIELDSLKLNYNSKNTGKSLLDTSKRNLIKTDTKIITN